MDQTIEEKVVFVFGIYIVSYVWLILSSTLIDSQ